MAWKIQLYSIVAYLILILGGFKLLPRESALFGMGMVPGGMALFGTIPNPQHLKLPNSSDFLSGDRLSWG